MREESAHFECVRVRVLVIVCGRVCAFMCVCAWSSRAGRRGRNLNVYVRVRVHVQSREQGTRFECVCVCARWSLCSPREGTRCVVNVRKCVLV